MCRPERLGLGDRTGDLDRALGGVFITSSWDATLMPASGLPLPAGIFGQTLTETLSVTSIYSTKFAARSATVSSVGCIHG